MERDFNHFRLDIEGFSGPLDLLCHMIDAGAIDAAKISVSQVIALYSAWLAQSVGMPIASVGEFIVQAAHLLRQKACSLLPRTHHDEDENEALFAGDSDGDVLLSENDGPIEQRLELYRPFRAAAVVLNQLKDSADKRWFRHAADNDSEPYFDLGNLYTLSVQWWNLLARSRMRRENALAAFAADDSGFEAMPDRIPDEEQVEHRMNELMRTLECSDAPNDGLSLRTLLDDCDSKTLLVVTLLALLELSRQNQVTLLQKELFTDVFIRKKRREPCLGE